MAFGLRSVALRERTFEERDDDILVEAGGVHR